MSNLQGIITILVLALAVIPHRARRYFSRENSVHLAINLVFAGVVLAVVLLGLGVVK